MPKILTKMLYLVLAFGALVAAYMYHRSQLIAEGYNAAMHEVSEAANQSQRELNKEIQRLLEVNNDALRKYQESKALLAGTLDRLSVHERWLREQNRDLARRLKEATPEACAAYAENLSGNYERLRGLAVRFGQEAAECAAIAHTNAQVCNAALNGPEPVQVKSE